MSTVDVGGLGQVDIDALKEAIADPIYGAYVDKDGKTGFIGAMSQDTVSKQLFYNIAYDDGGQDCMTRQNDFTQNCTNMHQQKESATHLS